MDLKHLESFLYVADLKSFSKAADKLFVSQPTITAHIQILEKELDCVLFNRLGHTITMTQAGEIFYKYAKNVVYTMGSAKLEISVSTSNMEGNVSILSSSVPKLFFLPEKMHDFSSTHDNINFSLTGLDSMSVVSSVKSGGCDFGFVGFKFSDPTLEYTRIFSDEICYLVNKDRFQDLAPFSEIEYSDIKDIPLMLREQGSGTYKTFMNSVDKPYSDLNKLPHSTIDSNEAIVKLIDLGFGGAFISACFAEMSNKIIPLRIKDVIINRPFYIVRHKNKTLSPGAEAFYEYLTEQPVE